MALLSIVDADRGWLKSRIGPLPQEIPRDQAFCAHTILSPDLMVVPDASKDRRFRDNPLVTGEPHIRFYAGAPLRDRQGFAVGAMAVLDRVPRRLGERQREALRVLGRQAVEQMERRRPPPERLRPLAHMVEITERRQAEVALKKWRAIYRELTEAIGDVLYRAEPSGRMIEVNVAVQKVYGYTVDEWLADPTLREKSVHPDDRARVVPLLRSHEQTDHPVVTEYRIVRKDGSTRTVHESFRWFPDETGALGVSGVITDISSEDQAAETGKALQQAHDRMQGLTRLLMQIRENERRQLARELHDEIGQVLTATKINLQSLERFHGDADFPSKMGESIRLVSRALEQVRSLSLELRPALLDDLGLSAALGWFVEECARRAGLAHEIDDDLGSLRLDPALETACFRVAQEAVNNVVKHASATHLAVAVHLVEKALHLRVRDNGCGFDAESARLRAVRGRSFGMLGMEERATLAGGGIEWLSSETGGTELHAWFGISPALGG